ncbi:VOC family protein [Paenibacillus sp. KN14-4R]|uniref:VOC family protein n=1 Tax=Paenibacillus sp. KN14-4R TaxID=3445773 RepID=UPI003F9ECA32
MQLTLRYVILYTNHPQESLTFYRDLLGLPIRGEHDSYIEFDTGSTILAINTRESVREITGLDIPDHHSRTYELGFTVTDVAATIEQLRQAGVTVVKEPLEKPWGQIVSYVSDPDGNLIEICSSLD